MSAVSAGAALRRAVAEESPLQIPGAINAQHALLARRAGYRAIYLSGGGVAAGSLGLPGVAIALYPLSAFRAANEAAENVYTALRRDGTQAGVVETMQTRAELYECIGYHAYEQRLDALFAAAAALR